MIDVELPVVIERQPDYTTCGPTSLHAIDLRSMETYVELGGAVRWGDLTPAPLEKVLGEGTSLTTGVDGTYLHRCIRETEQGPDDVKSVGSDDGNLLRIRPKDWQARRAERAS